MILEVNKEGKKFRFEFRYISFILIGLATRLLGRHPGLSQERGFFFFEKKLFPADVTVL